MSTKTRVKTHPGRVLRAELEARGMSGNLCRFELRYPNSAEKS